ncbi:DUF47 domain-containing protein [Tepidibacillus fermentans]|uniref:DUF47 domain-containing protein n=1 Tax=Tepidibacillus fermentans TaxID=1281767 RepID=A0A4R3KGH4_9BACI|nr:DUF47 domain-containing protein [Tepidibacillus fermentans]TCS82119.1 hypothetical protein EDD72_11055 [Tepidibacillus fermentans]
MLFTSKKDKFLEMLLSIAKNLEDAAHYFVDFKIHNEEDLKEFQKTMKEYEKNGDSIIHHLIVTLNKSFITPIEREDILELAMKMDDVLDGFERCASRLDMYNITLADQYMVTFVDKIYESSKEVVRAAELLSEKKLMDIRPHVIKINDYESECDDLLRDSIKQLFLREKDPIKVIQYKEIYETLESISDSCEDVGNTLETIIMRNA